MAKPDDPQEPGSLWAAAGKHDGMPLERFIAKTPRVNTAAIGPCDLT
jgi:hypothetical protein